MPDLQHSLQSQDLGFLKIIADFWGVDFTAPDVRQGLPKLVSALQDQELVLEVVEALPETAQQALTALQQHAGWTPWSRLIRDFGELREVGPGKRDREQPYRHPVSATEVLWYRGLIGRGFLRRDGKLQECAYIPEDLLTLLPPTDPTHAQPLGRAASKHETQVSLPATDRVLDHCCTLLAALRLGDLHRSPAADTWQPPLEVVHELLRAVNLISSEEEPVAEDARPFLEMSRAEALAWLVDGWRQSDQFNELWLMPGVVCEGAWQNDPRVAREQLLTWLADLPAGEWWQMDAFVDAIFEQAPDFQRPAGDFDTWLIRQADTGDSLSGIEHWQEVDGALIRYLITGPLHWLGLVDLAARAEGDPASAFRLSTWAADLLQGQAPAGIAAEEDPLKALSDGRLLAGAHSPRIARYQAARFGLWLAETDTTYTYQLTPQSLAEAAEQGLKISHLETLLNKYGDPPPPSLVQALHQWEKDGQQARIHPCVVLRVGDPKILQALRSTPADRFLGDVLGPTVVTVNPGAVEKVRSALARLGYLTDVDFAGEDWPELPDEQES
jgi:hypothetical protein